MTAIAISMIMMIVSVATGIGLQQKIREKVSAFNGHIIISNFDNNQSQTTDVPISKNQDFYPKFTHVPGVTHIQAVASKSGIIRTEETFEGIVFKGIGPDYDWREVEGFLTEGKLPSVEGELVAEVLISEYLAKRLGLSLGSKFNTFFIKEDADNPRPNLLVCTISGIYNSGLQEFDATHVLGDIRHLQRINKWKPDQVGAFEVFIDDFSKIESMGRAVYENTFSSQNPAQSLDAQTIADKYYHIFEWLVLFDFNIIVILVVMMAVATINMVVALLVLILERTQLIGILKAMGAGSWLVRKIFLYNAAYLILRGLFWGNLIGISMVLLQQHFGIVKLNPENYYVSEAPVYLNFMHVLWLNVGTMLVCLLVLLVPSAIIARISPVRAIRFD